MRYLRDIPNARYKISLYQWNGKYIIKFEAGGQYEQIYKLDETEVTSDEEIDALADKLLLRQVEDRFRAMHEDFMDALRRSGIIF
ncbi:MAG: hypothetical protein ABS46_18745 [Cytophagaceae bacterium SCN 52-12]|nr:MAG: hypothetical protein ABS46_18745 [Cytophagaceae bacterium SCN 52-12]